MQPAPTFIGQINSYFLSERLLTTPWGVLFRGRPAGTFRDCVLYLVSASRTGVDMASIRAHLDAWENALREAPYYGRTRMLLPATVEKVKVGADLLLSREDSPEQPVAEGDVLLVYPDASALTLVERPGLATGGVDEALTALARIAAFLTYARKEGLEFNGPVRTGVGQVDDQVLLCDPLLFPREDPDRAQPEGGAPAGPATWHVTPEEQRRCLAVLLVERLTNSRGRPLAEMQAHSGTGIAQLCPDLTAAQAVLVARALRTGVSAADLSASQFISRMHGLSALAHSDEPRSRRTVVARVFGLILLFAGMAGATFFALGKALG